MKMTTAEKIGHGVIAVILFGIAVLCVYPFWYVIMYSLSDSNAALSGGLFLWPKEFSLKGYQLVLQQKQIYVAYWNTILRTAAGTALSLVLTAMLAYPLSLPRLRGRGFLCLAIFFTMLFNGGIIPTYLVVNDLGMVDTLWSLIIPNAMSAYNLFIMRNYFQSLPPSLEESARIDGAGTLTILTRIILPLSGPTLAAVGMFYGVANWNAYMDGVLYINKPELQILQIYLRNLLASAGSSSVLSGVSNNLSSQVNDATLQMVVIAVSVIPILIVYPKLQKFYIKGVITGSVKG